MSIIEKIITEIIINQIDNADIDLKNHYIDSTISLENLGFDSVEVADLLVKIQRKFTIKLKLDNFNQLPTLNAIYQYVETESERQGSPLTLSFREETYVPHN